MPARAQSVLASAPRIVMFESGTACNYEAKISCVAVTRDYPLEPG